MDPVTAPIVLKAVDWLFGEGSRILQERRERRRADQKAEEQNSEAVAPLAVPSNAIRSKEAALGSPVIEAVWLDKEAKIKHLLSLLDIHAKNYRLASEQYAKWGSAMVPPIIVHNLSEAEDEIKGTAGELQTVLSAVYGKKVAVPEVERS